MVGICHLTDSHHNHHGQKPTMVGICHGGNMLGNQKQELFIGLLLFQTNYPFLLQISHVRELHIFWRNFFCLKNWGLVIFLTNVKSVTGVLCGRWPFFCSVLFPRSLYLCRSLTIRKITQLKGADGMKKNFVP